MTYIILWNILTTKNLNCFYFCLIFRTESHYACTQYKLWIFLEPDEMGKNILNITIITEWNSVSLLILNKLPPYIDTLCLIRFVFWSVQNRTLSYYDEKINIVLRVFSCTTPILVVAFCTEVALEKRPVNMAHTIRFRLR